MNNMKKILSLVLALTAATTMIFAESLTTDCGTQVQITATPTTGYHFVRWNDNNTDNPRIVDASNTTYTAYFAINTYTIRFMNGTEVLKTCTVNHGETPVYGLAEPTKAATAQYTYAFSGWSPTIYAADKDQDYVAQFTSTLRSYTITFKNYDGTVLYSTDFDFGTTPTYSGTTPTRPTTDGVEYSFVGWRKQGASVNGIDPVDGEAVYVAQYSSATLTYTINVNVQTEGTGTVTPASGTASGTYGTSVSISATPAECYRFVKWSDNNTEASRTIVINGNATYTAIFEKITYTVVVESDNTSQGTVSVTTVP